MHKIKCSQYYDNNGEMKITPCSRCDAGWDGERCRIQSGAEDLPPAILIPNCPIESICQHQIQANPKACAVRLAGYICESALRYSGIENAEEHPLAFNADWVNDSGNSETTNGWMNGVFLKRSEEHLSAG